MPNTPNRSTDWAAVRALFDSLLPLPPEARQAALATSRAAADVLHEVRSLLAHAGEAHTGFLAQPAAPHPGATAATAATAATGDATHTALPPADAAAPDRVGQRIGPWRIDGLLGRGGMGEVWSARRDDGAFDGRAAIKVLRRGLDSQRVLARFALEQQALARLNHPHIAHLLDAGRTADGLPYVVMEAVDGDTIDRACVGLPVEHRLALFLQLTDAVAHAHRNLLVHRDLKPSNVLVTRGAPAGQVKLLDFGIAKAIDPLEGADGHTTQAGERPYTPHYASPEQVRGEPVGTATDVYSLGVLLYVMLTGVRPYGRDATSALEAARSVLEETPTRPSALSPGLVADPMWLATRRRLEGDLDNILLKALDKRIAHRYPSVDALAADVRATLTGHPVSARAPRAGYLLGKFIQRNRGAAAATALAVLALVGGAALSTWQAWVAQQQRQLAERRFDEVRRFARTMLFDVDTALRDGPTAGREKLVQTALEYLDRLSAERVSDRAVDAPLLRDVAEAYERVGDIQGNTMQANLGRPQDAQASFAKALALRQALAAQAPADLDNVAGLLKAHERLGDNTRSQGRLADAAQHYAEAARFAGTLARAQPAELKPQLRRIEAERYLASVHYWPYHPSLGDHARGRQAIEALNTEMDALLARHPGQPEVLEAAAGLVNQLSDFQRLAGDYPATLATQRKSVALAQRLAAPAPANPRWQRWLYLAEGRLADALIDTGDTEAGLAMWRQSISRREAVAQQDPENERAQRNVANGYGPLAEQLDALGRPAEALAWYQRELGLLQRLHTKHPQVAALAGRLDDAQRDLALLLVRSGQVAEGERLMRALLARRAQAAAPQLAAAASATGASATAAASVASRAPSAPSATTTTLDSDEPHTAARQAVAEAWVLTAAGAKAAERATLQARAEAAVRRLASAAAAEPFNVWWAFEAASAAASLGQSLQATQPAAACAWLRQAETALDGLQRQQRLSAPQQAVLLPRLRARLQACAPLSAGQA